MRAVDWDALRLVSGSTVDQALSERRSDLLFSARFAASPLPIYFLIEHQSVPDGNMPFRLLRYMVRIWDEYLQQHPGAERLPAILPVAVHHGSQGWTAPTRFEQLIALPDQMPAELPVVVLAHVPSFALVLDDLHTQRDEALAARPMPARARLSLLALKWARQEPDVLKHLRRHATLVREVAEAPDGVRALETILRYLMTGIDIPVGTLQAFFRQLGSRAEEAYMTTAQMSIEQGRIEGEARGEARGRIEGEARGKAEALLKILERRGIVVSDLERERVRGCRDHVLLESWLDRALVVGAAEDLFA